MKLHKYIWGLVVLSVIGTLWLYPMLPENIPIHWNLKGVPDNYGNKLFAVFTAVLPVIMAFLMMFFPKIDPKKESYQKHAKAYGMFMNMLVLFLVVLHWVTIAIALGYKINIVLVVNISIGILFVGIGNYMGQIRHNYFLGVRTPWTLANEQVWVKTHRKASWVFIGLGLLFILNGFWGNETGYVLSILFVVGSVVYLYIYSYFEYKRING